jgi:hypothetical protein
MKKSIKTLTFALFIALPVLALAQRDSPQNPSAQHKAKAIAVRMAEDLQLTPAQTTATEQLALERFQNLKLENPTDENRFQRVNDKALHKLATILTKAQYERYQALRADLKMQKDDFLRKNPNHRFSDAYMELDF